MRPTLIAPYNRRVDNRTPFWLTDDNDRGQLLLRDGFPILFVPHAAQDPFGNDEVIPEARLWNIARTTGRWLYVVPEKGPSVNPGPLNRGHNIFRIYDLAGSEQIAWCFYGKARTLA
jgi:hypothetical protein